MPIMAIIRMYNLLLCLSWISSDAALDRFTCVKTFLGEGEGVN